MVDSSMYIYVYKLHNYNYTENQSLSEYDVKKNKNLVFRRFDYSFYFVHRHVKPECKAAFRISPNIALVYDLH